MTKMSNNDDLLVDIEQTAIKRFKERLLSKETIDATKIEPGKAFRTRRTLELAIEAAEKLDEAGDMSTTDGLGT